MVLLAGCQNPKNDLLPQEVRNRKTTETSQNSFRTVGDSIFQRNGRLVFKDASVLRNTMVALAGMSSEEKQAFENRFEGYNSWRKYNQDNAGNDNVLPLYFQADSSSLPSFFTALVNIKREYQVGKTITYLEEGQTYGIPEDQENSLKQEGWFKASTLGNFQTNSLRTVANAKYQYPYRRGNTEYKQVFEVASVDVTGTGSILYLRQKLEYWGWINWFRKDWRKAGEVRTMNMVGISGTSVHQAGMYPHSSVSVQNRTNVTSDNELLLNITIGGASFWRYNVSVNFMEIFVPSHSQQAYLSSGWIFASPSLVVNNATFVKLN